MVPVCKFILTKLRGGSTPIELKISQIQKWPRSQISFGSLGSDRKSIHPVILIFLMYLNHISIFLD